MELVMTPATQERATREGGERMNWYVIKEIPRPPYELTWGEHDTHAEADQACPDDPAFTVRTQPASDRVLE